MSVHVCHCCLQVEVDEEGGDLIVDPHSELPEGAKHKMGNMNSKQG